MSSDPHTPSDRPTTEPGAPGQWLKSNLVGLGSAAVLAVYAAGFERTRAAAAKFSEADARRRVPLPVRTTGNIGALMPRTPDSDTKPAPLTTVAPKPVTHAAPRSAPQAKSRSRAPDSTHVQEKHAVDSTVPAAPAKAPAPTTTSAVARDSVIAVVPAAVPAPTKPIEAPVAPKPATAADTAQSEKETVRKDGTYTGWGTSRHGDIQATIQIKDGKIVFAAISECLTQYSCSWIAALPPQVIARQSADVDFVSGATQSTNAFYYAVLQALNKAK